MYGSLRPPAALCAAMRAGIAIAELSLQ